VIVDNVLYQALTLRLKRQQLLNLQKKKVKTALVQENLIDNCYFKMFIVGLQILTINFAVNY